MGLTRQFRYPLTCLSCEEQPNQPGDFLCEGCRAVVEENMETMHDPVEIVLNDHQMIRLPDYRRLCVCGDVFETPADYRRHVADLIYQSLGVVRPEKTGEADA